MPSSNFNTCLAKGKLAERTIAQALNLQPNSFGADLISPLTGTLYEVKADYRPNYLFFIEWSTGARKDRLAGPLRALQEGAEFYVCYKVCFHQAFVIKTRRLIDFIEASNFPLKTTSPTIGSNGGTWTNTGYAVSIWNLLIISENVVFLPSPEGDI